MKKAEDDKQETALLDYWIEIDIDSVLRYYASAVFRKTLNTIDYALDINKGRVLYHLCSK